MDTNGNTVKDTSGNIIYTDKKAFVTAYVEEILRKKNATLAGRIVIYKANNKTHLNTIPISLTYDFEDYSCGFRGDERALTIQTKERLKESCNNFPSDYDIITNLAYSYKDIAENRLSKEYFR